MPHTSYLSHRLSNAFAHSCLHPLLLRKLLHDIHQFIDGFGSFSGPDTMADTIFVVPLVQGKADFLQGSVPSADFHYYIHAVTIFCDHLLYAADLAFYALQAVN